MTDQSTAELLERIARREAEDAKQNALWCQLSDATPGEYREGFIDGYLRAHDDGDEYACSIEAAELAFGKYLSEGGRTLTRHDVGGW